MQHADFENAEQLGPRPRPRDIQISIRGSDSRHEAEYPDEQEDCSNCCGGFCRFPLVVDWVRVPKFMGSFGWDPRSSGVRSNRCPSSRARIHGPQ